MTAWDKTAPSYSSGDNVTVSFDKVRDTHFLLASQTALNVGAPVFPGYNTIITYNNDNTVNKVNLAHVSDGTQFEAQLFYVSARVSRIDYWYKPNAVTALTKLPSGRFTFAYNASNLITTITNTSF